MDNKKLITLSKSIRQNIVNKINIFNNLKKERSQINKTVKELKIKREEEVKKIKKYINELKELNKKKSNIGIEDTKKIKDLIDKKEWFFQINVFSIKKEEALIKEIKELRNKLKKSNILNSAINKIRELIKKLEKTRKEHNFLHENVIKNAEKSNEISKKMKVVQKSIKELKKEGKVYKKEISKLKLKGPKRNFNTKNKNNELIKKKQEKVLEKLKQKKKLTNEDLIAFQK